MKSFKSIVLLSLVFFGWVPQSNADEKKPFHFAHCGGAHEFEENTLFAFKNCYEKGIRGYELDVRMTRDIMLIKGGPLTPDLMEAAKAIGSRRIAAKMEGTTRLAVINLHSGDLPKYRGVMATFRAMMNREDQISSTLNWIEDSKIDPGAIISSSLIDTENFTLKELMS